MLKTNPNQDRLQEVVHLLFPNNKITVNVQKAGYVYAEERRRYLELDVWVPELNLAFEYQDPHHYATTWYGNAPIADVHGRDNMKSSQVTARGATLITVPCWWDGHADSLVATIQSQRIDLLRGVHTDAAPIPSQPPSDFFRAPLVPGVGELMLAYFPASSEQFVNKIWWASEKYDGVRACWNGAGLYSRFGRLFSLADSANDTFPKRSLLDGEIWFGRGNYEEKHRSAFLLEDLEESTKFDLALFVLFDHPTNDISQEYEDRYTLISNLIPRDHPFITIASCCKCTTIDQRFKLLESITSENGEGIILRRAKSEYLSGRSDSLLKCKVVRDLDALVIELDEEAAICRLQLADGTATQAHLEHPPGELKIGDVVSFQFEDFDKSGKPYGARVTRIRDDMSWIDALQAPRQSSIHGLSELTFQAPQERKPPGYWTIGGVENTRKFFDEYAKAHHFDPLVASNWYPVTRQQVIAFKPYEHGPLTQRAGSRNLHKLLMESYPDIGLEEAKFDVLPRKFWARNQRSALESYATRMNFDPLVPENWYSVSVGDALSEKGARLVRYIYGSFAEMLVRVFPDVTFEVEKFRALPRNYWNDWGNRKKFFDSVAKRDNFDPLIAENWYPYKREELRIKRISPYNNCSIVAALTDVYPTLSLDPSKFVYVPQHFYANSGNQRAFFENVARKNNFDPLVAENWYNISTDKISSERGGRTVLAYFSSFHAALQHSFPEVTIEGQKFRMVPGRYWQSRQNLRQLLSDTAVKLGLDPLNAANWYSVKWEQVIHFPKVHSALCYHKGRLADAVLHAFPDIGLDRSRFWYLRYWLSIENRRLYFIRYAEKSGFDPLVAGNWYSLSYTNLKKEKGAFGLLRHCSERKMLLHEALHEAMPELGLDLSLFWKSKSRKFKDISLLKPLRKKKIINM